MQDLRDEVSSTLALTITTSTTAQQRRRPTQTHTCTPERSSKHTRCTRKGLCNGGLENSRNRAQITNHTQATQHRRKRHSSGGCQLIGQRYQDLKKQVTPQTEPIAHRSAKESCKRVRIDNQRPCRSCCPAIPYSSHRTQGGYATWQQSRVTNDGDAQSTFTTPPLLFHATRFTCNHADRRKDSARDHQAIVVA
eukprot:TRINITY_DN5185_c0_g1_i4.p2 TRINITY_DN5185_c0_g1~~TRINITY_DN5185_c0_g1_i4.p2  ORF type:complete len:194 (+),score=5.56 TRINITY_DN5185_c0_g1_i4:551-1132(+)